MNDPHRWLGKPNELLSLEQRLLKSGKSLKPPAGSVDQGWNDFLALVGPFAGGPGHAGPAGTGAEGALTQPTALGKIGLARLAGAVTKASLGKLTITVAAVGAAGTLAVFGNHLATRQDVPAADQGANAQAVGPPPLRPEALPKALPVATSSAAPAASARLGSPRSVANPDPMALQTEPTSPFGRQETEPTSPLAQPPTRTDDNHGAPEPIGTAVMPSLDDQPESLGKFPATEPARLSELRAEATSIAQAKNLMSAGQFQAALSLLNQVARRFPAGVLLPEREALTIEALAGAGALPLAEQRAARFLAQYPQSPLSNKIRKFVRPQ